jgi:hypothetical protein
MGIELSKVLPINDLRLAKEGGSQPGESFRGGRETACVCLANDVYLLQIRQ